MTCKPNVARRSLLAGFLGSAAIFAALCGTAGAADGDTKVLKWKDGKQAVFLLSYDDSCPTHLTNAIPELEKRGLVGNFYIVPGKGTYPGKKAQWEKIVSSPSVAIQNHTFTHVGATSVEQLEDELVKCNDAIKLLLPTKKWPRLIGWGRPGGVPWTVSKEDQAAALAKHNLIDRPPFWGPPIHQKSAAECIATIDKAIEKGDMGHLDMHGVGGDWLVTPMDWYVAILDKLVAEKERVWTADFIDYHRYLKERETAAAKVVQTVPTGIKLSLTSAADPAFYDYPLTLETSVPAAWKSCVVKQAGKETTVAVSNGVVRYDAVPGKDEITLIAK